MRKVFVPLSCLLLLESSKFNLKPDRSQAQTQQIAQELKNLAQAKTRLSLAKAPNRTC